MELIYLDNAATTRPYKEVLDKNSKYNEDCFYNASALYRGGLNNASSLSEARNNICKMFNPDFNIIFTSCGSESDNMAINSYAKRGNIVTTLGEHPAVYNTMMDVKSKGIEVRFAKLNSNGSVNEEDLYSLIDNNTQFVSVVHVNNETGAINNINEIARNVKEINKRVVFHSDGVQAFGKIPTKVSSLVDLYSISAHKINGLKGVGGLFVNKKLTTIHPLIFGGGQEFNLRSGTENVFGIKVLEDVYKNHHDTIKEDYERIKSYKEYFVANLSDKIKLISTGNTSPYVISVSCVGKRGEVLSHMMEDDGIICGTGSACSSKHRFSRMLSTINEYTPDILDGILRFSFSKDTKIEEVEYAVKCLNKNVDNYKG